LPGRVEAEEHPDRGREPRARTTAAGETTVLQPVRWLGRRARSVAPPTAQPPPLARRPHGAGGGYYYNLTFPERVRRSVLIEAAFPCNGRLQHTRWPARPMRIQGSPRCSVETALICGNEEGAKGLRERLATFDKARLVVLGGLGHIDVCEKADLIQEAFLAGGPAALPPVRE